MIRATLKSWAYQPWQVISTLLVLTGVFAVCFSFVVIQSNVNSVLSHWGSDFKVNVYLREAANDEQVQSVRKKLEAQTIFRGLEFLSKEKALEKFRARLGFLGADLVESGELDNPLPASFEATLDTGVAGFVEKLDDISRSLLKDKSIEDISYGQSWVENYAAMVSSFNYLALALAALLFCGAILLASSVIRTSIMSRREEIEIKELFGATRFAISKPFLLEGLLLGVIAGIASILVVRIGYAILLHTASHQIQLWSLDSVVRFPGALVLFGFFVVCMGVVGVGSYLSVRRISTGWAAAEK